MFYFNPDVEKNFGQWLAIVPKRPYVSGMRPNQRPSNRPSSVSGRAVDGVQTNGGPAVPAGKHAGNQLSSIRSALVGQIKARGILLLGAARQDARISASIAFLLTDPPSDVHLFGKFSVSVIKINEHNVALIPRFGHASENFDGLSSHPVQHSMMEADKKAKYTELLTSEFGFSAEDAEQSYRSLIQKDFASHTKPLVQSSLNDQISSPLTVPSGDVERYQGKRVSGDVFEFLQRVYKHEDGNEPLTLADLRKNDFKAYQAYYNESRLGRRPDGFQLPKWGAETDRVLTEAGIDLSTAEGEKHARRVMNAINVRLYPRP